MTDAELLDAFVGEIGKRDPDKSTSGGVCAATGVLDASTASSAAAHH